MCCCEKPNINGEMGYSWDGESIGVRPASAPEVAERDVILFDEPGRCGGMDSHCHHYRLVKNVGTYLLVRNGGGDQRLRVSLPRGFSLEFMDSNTRYWILNAIYHAHSDGISEARTNTAAEFRKAFAEGRLKKRKLRGSNSVKVWIEDRLRTPEQPGE
jgi:hypothetical protein